MAGIPRWVNRGAQVTGQVLEVLFVIVALTTILISNGMFFPLFISLLALAVVMAVSQSISWLSRLVARRWK